MLPTRIRASGSKGLPQAAFLLAGNPVSAEHPHSLISTSSSGSIYSQDFLLDVSLASSFTKIGGEHIDFFLIHSVLRHCFDCLNFVPEKPGYSGRCKGRRLKCIQASQQRCSANFPPLRNVSAHDVRLF